jgi:hypothetical protein
MSDDPTYTFAVSGIEAGRNVLGRIADVACHDDTITYLTRHGDTVAAVVPREVAEHALHYADAPHSPDADRLATKVFAWLESNVVFDTFPHGLDEQQLATVAVWNEALHAVTQDDHGYAQIKDSDDPVKALTEYVGSMVYAWIAWSTGRSALWATQRAATLVEHRRQQLRLPRRTDTPTATSPETE